MRFANEIKKNFWGTMKCFECVRGGWSSRWGVCSGDAFEREREEEGKQEGSLASASSAALRLTQHIALAHQHYTLQSTNLTKYQFRTKGTPIHQKVKYRTRNAVTNMVGQKCRAVCCGVTGAFQPPASCHHGRRCIASSTSSLASLTHHFCCKGHQCKAYLRVGQTLVTTTQ
jgi:hypothetical protein